MSLDDWTWHLTSDQGRTRRLRDAMQSMAARHSATTSRLNSQVNRLRGSIEKRLDALSVAFDAYVELGDVREQLGMLPDWSDTRIEVERTLNELMEDGEVHLIDGEKHDHWLAHAMNAVVTLGYGQDATVHEQRAAAMSDEAAEFIVLACLALDLGDKLNGRLANQFAGIEEFDELRWLLLRAVGYGLVPSSEIQQLGQHLEPHLDDPEAWRSWLGITPGTLSGWRTVEEFLTCKRTRTGEQWSIDSVDDELREAAAVRARSSSVEERELWMRADVLRRRIEDPTARVEPTPQQTVQPIIPSVQLILNHPAVSPEIYAAMVAWTRKPMQALVERALETPPPEPSSEAVRKSLSTPKARLTSVRVDVTAQGPDDQQLRSARNQLQQVQTGKVNGKSVIGASAVAAAVGFLLFLLGDSLATVGVLLLIAGACGAVWGIMLAREQGKVEQNRAQALQELNSDAEKTAQRLRSIDEESQRVDAEERAEAQQFLGTIPQLPQPVDLAPPAGPAFSNPETKD